MSEIKHINQSLSNKELIVIQKASNSGKSYFVQDNFEEIEVEDENGVKQKMIRYKGLLSNAFFPKQKEDRKYV